MINSLRHEPYDHSYKVGDMVTFDPRGGQLRNPPGVFSVLAQLPPSGSDLQYRIKSMSDSHQRVVAEHQLMPPARTASE